MVQPINNWRPSRHGSRHVASILPDGLSPHRHILSTSRGDDAPRPVRSRSVHGFTQGPSGWDALRPELQERGHETLTVDLRMEELADAGGLQCAEVIAETVKQAGSPVHLVGTSGSGALVPLVPSLAEVERLVFICAGLPDLGRSLADQIEKDHVLGDDWMEEEDTSSSEAARKFMFNDCDEETTEWALKTVRLFSPQRVYEEVCPLERWPDVASTYILGTGDRIIRGDWAREAVRNRLGIELVEMATGHCPHVSRPKELADLLIGQ